MRKLLKYTATICIGLLTVLAPGCKQKHIPQKDMVSILSEIFITDATTNTSYLAIKFSRKDTIEYYKPIFSKYSYTEEEFVYTLNYYLDNPDEFEKLLDKVIGKLSVLETEKAQSLEEDNKPEQEREEIEGNLWTRKRNWELPKNGSKERLYFKIPTQGAGLYTVSADVLVQPDDEAISPSMHVWFYTEEEPPDFRFNPKKEEYLKDGEKRTVTIRSMLTDTTMTHFMGYLIDHQPRTGKWAKHADVSNITIIYTPLPKKERKPTLTEPQNSSNETKQKKPKVRNEFKKSQSMELFNKTEEIERK